MWSKIAERYRNQADTENQLVDTAASAGAENWTDETGGIAMPANSPGVEGDDIRNLVKYILALPDRDPE